jgi:hypothetical protein
MDAGRTGTREILRARFDFEVAMLFFLEPLSE